MSRIEAFKLGFGREPVRLPVLFGYLAPLWAGASSTYNAGTESEEPLDRVVLAEWLPKVEPYAPGPHQTLESFFGHPSRVATRFDRSLTRPKRPIAFQNSPASLIIATCVVSPLSWFVPFYEKTTHICKLTFLIPSWATRKPPRLPWTCMNLFIFSNT